MARKAPTCMPAFVQLDRQVEEMNACAWEEATV